MTSEKLLLGRISEVNDYDLVVNLLNGQRGKVAITNINDAYTKILKEISKEDGSEAPQVSPLSELFQVGQLIRCTQLNTPTGSQMLRLSTNPQAVNTSVSPQHLKKASVTFQASVTSAEDHGYSIDLGIVGVHCFLPRENVDEIMNVGQIIVVKSNLESSSDLRVFGSEARVVRFTAKKSVVEQHVISSSVKLPVGYLQPGHLIKGMVKVMKKGKLPGGGLCIGFQEQLIIVPKEHCNRVPSSFMNKEEVVVRILSVDTMNREVIGSLLPHFMPEKIGWFNFNQVHVGLTIPSAKVERIEKRSAILRAIPDEEVEKDDKNKLRIFIRKVNYADKGDEEVVPKVGDIFSCRVLDFDLIRNLAIGSMRKSVLSLEFLRLDEVSPGDQLRCVVVKHTPGGVLVRLSAAPTVRALQGFIPNIHVADSHVTNPEQHLSVGQEIRCRVLVVDVDKKKLVLTAKPSLVKSKLPRLYNLEQLSRGEIAMGSLIHGFVVQVSEKGLLVAFYNNVKGWIGRRDLDLAETDILSKVFRVGQPLRCRVLSFSVPHRSMRLSLLHSLSPKPYLNSVDIGQYFETAVVVKRHSDGVDVSLPGFPSARLPVNHLTDSSTLCQAVLMNLEEGTQIDGGVAVWGKGVGGLIVTAKPSMLRAAKEGRLKVGVKDETVGRMVMGVVAANNKRTYGLFVEMADGVRGLSPVKYVTDKPIYSAVTTLMRPGQTVEAKIVELCPEKKRLLLSLRPKDCYFCPTHVAAQVKATEEFVTTLRKIKHSETKGLGSLTEGSVISVKVVTVPEAGEGLVKCEMEDNTTPCIVQMPNTEGISLHRGMKVDALVIHRNFEAGHTELCLSSVVVKAVKNRQENRYTEVKEGQELKSEVLLVNEDFILVHLKAHGAGRLAYMPSRRQWNDTVHRRQFVVGQLQQVIVKKVIGDDLVVNLKSLEPLGKYRRNPTSTDTNTDQETDSVLFSEQGRYQPGSRTSVRILEVFSCQLNVETVDTGRRGRIFITNLRNDQLPLDGVGSNPLTSIFSKGQALNDVRVIGTRSIKKNQPTFGVKEKRPLFSRSLLEFCLTDEDRKINVGDKIPVFFFFKRNKRLYFHVRHDLHAFCRYLNLGSSLSEITEIMKSCENGSISQGALFYGRVLKCSSSGSRTRTDEKGEKTSGRERMMEITLLSEDLTKGSRCCARVDRVHNLGAKLLLPGTPKSRGYLTVFDAMVAGENLPNDAKEVLSERVKMESMVDVELLSYYNEVWRCRLIDSPAKWKDIPVQNFGFVRGSTYNPSQLLISLPPGSPGELPQTGVLEARSAEQKFEIRRLKVGRLVRVVPLPDGNVSEQKLRLSHWAVIEKAVQEMVEVEESEEEELEEADLDRRAVINIVSRRGTQKEFACLDDNVIDGMEVGEAWEEESNEKKKRRQLGKKRMQDTKEEDDERPLSKKQKNERGSVSDLHQFQAIKGEPTTPEGFDLWVLNEPNSGRAWSRYIRLYTGSGDLDKAREVGERALNTISSNAEKARSQVFGTLIELELGAGDVEACKMVLTRAWQQAPDGQVGKIAGDLLLSKDGDVELAVETARQFVRRCPMNQDAWLLLNRARRKAGQFEQARESVRGALKALVLSAQPGFIIRLARDEMECGQAPRAVKLLQDGMKSSSRIKEQLIPCLVEALRCAGREEEANEKLEEAMKESKNLGVKQELARLRNSIAEDKIEVDDDDVQMTTDDEDTNEVEISDASDTDEEESDEDVDDEEERDEDDDDVEESDEEGDEEEEEDDEEDNDE